MAAPAEPVAAVAQAEGEPLTLALLPRLGPALGARIAGWGEDALADLSYANLWLFRHAHVYRFHDGDWPCIGGRSYDGQRHAIPLFPPAAAPGHVLHGLIARHGSLFPLAAPEKQALDPGAFHFTHNRDDADYLYPAAQMRDYPGRILQKKRNLVAQLHQAHTVVARAFVPALAADALAVLDAWLADKCKAPGEADDAPAREALARADLLGLEGFVHYADGEPAGFLLAEELQPATWVVRFAKGSVRFKGIAPHMFQHFAGHAPRPAKWLNFEQDLGLPNFRRTKQSFLPARLLDKWRARSAGPAAGGPRTDPFGEQP